MRAALLAFVIVVASAAPAVALPPTVAPQIDLSDVRSQAAAALAAAQAAQAQAAAASAAIPTPCTAAPLMDTTNGSAGTPSKACTTPADASRAAITQLATAIGGGVILTATDGSFSGIWPRAWATAPGYAHAEIYGSSTPYLCMVISATSSGVNGKCYQTVTTALPGTLLALGSTIVNPLSAATAGLTVRVSGRQ